MKLTPSSTGIADRLALTLPRRVSQPTTPAWNANASRFTQNSMVANNAARSASDE
jgi:hypothetical protein